MNEMLFDSSGFELPQALEGLTSKAKITLFKALVKDPTDTKTYPVYDDNVSQNGRHVYHSKDNKQTFEVYQDDTGHTYVKRYNNDGEIIKVSGDWKIIDKGKAEGKTATPATEENFTSEGKLSPPTLNPSLEGSLSTYNYADREVVVANDNGSAISKEYIIDVNKFHSKLSAENLRDGKGLLVGYDLGKGSYKLTYLEEPTLGIHPDNPDRVTFSQGEYGVEASAGLGAKIEIQKPADVLKFSEKVKLTAGISATPSLDGTMGNSEYIQSLPEADRLQLQNEAIKYELSGQSATDLEQGLQLSDPDFPLTTISRDYNIPQLTDDQRTKLEQRLLDNQERLVNEYGINTSEVANPETSTEYETPVANTDLVPEPQVENNGQQSLSNEDIYKGFPENYNTPTDDTVSDNGSEDNTDDFASPSASLSDTGGKDDTDDFASPSASVSDTGGEDDTDDFASPSATVTDTGGEDDTDDFASPSATVSDTGGEDDTDDFTSPSASVSDTGGEDDTDAFISPSASVSDTGGEDDTDNFASPSASVADTGGEDATGDFELPSAATFENSAVAEYPVASGNENKSSIAGRESNNNSTQGSSVYPGSVYANSNNLSSFNTSQQPLPSFNDQMSSLSSISNFISEQEGASAPNNSDTVEPNFSATNAATPGTLNTEVVPDTYNNLSSPVEFDGTGAESTYDGTGAETTYDGTGAESTYDGTGSETTYDGTSTESTNEGTASETTYDGTGAESTYDGTGAETTYDGTGAETTYDGTGAETTYDGTGAESTNDGTGSETTYTEPETADIGEPDSSDTSGSDSSDYGSSDSGSYDSSDSGGYDSSASSSDSGSYDSGSYDSSDSSSDSGSYESSDSGSYDSSSGSSDSGSYDSSDSGSYDSSASTSDSGSYDSSSSSSDSSGSSDSGSSDSGGGGDSGSGSGGDTAGSAI